MNINISNRPAKQKGMVTLFTSVILLVAITLVALLTAKTVIQETKMTANNYRAAQAMAEAGGAMDYAIAYFNDGGFDQDGVAGIDDILPAITLSAGICTPVLSAKAALITATGTSDDGIASRTISQCVGTIDIFGKNEPKQPMISRGGVGLTGNFTIVNRVNNTNIWSGNNVEIGNSASASTSIWDHSQIRPDVTATDPEIIAANREIFEDTSGANLDVVSTRTLGSGVDIIDHDINLSLLSDEDVFNGFFPSGRDGMKAIAEGIDQLVAADQIGTLDGKDGVMWVDGNANMTGLTFGSPDHPVALIIDGNLNVSGNPTIYGVLYVRGQLDAGGTVTVIGSTIVEGDSAMVPAGEEPVVGNGTVNLIYTPFTQGRAPNGIRGTRTVISGSWRDWQ